MVLWVTCRLLVANQVFLGNYSKPDLLRTSSTLGYDERNPVEFCIDETGCEIMMYEVASWILMQLLSWFQNISLEPSGNSTVFCLVNSEHACRLILFCCNDVDNLCTGIGRI